MVKNFATLIYRGFLQTCNPLFSCCGIFIFLLAISPIIGCKTNQLLGGDDQKLSSSENIDRHQSEIDIPDYLVPLAEKGCYISLNHSNIKPYCDPRETVDDCEPEQTIDSVFIASCAQINLKQMNLSNQLLKYSNFNAANLSNSTLVKTNFKNAYGQWAEFKSIQANYALFSGGVFTGANFFKANLVGAEFVGSSLLEANFKNSALNGAKFDYANLRKANFTNANLVGVSFKNAYLKEAVFDGANLYHADFSQAQELSNADFSGAKNINQAKHLDLSNR